MNGMWVCKYARLFDDGAYLQSGMCHPCESDDLETSHEAAYPMVVKEFTT